MKAGTGQNTSTANGVVGAGEMSEPTLYLDGRVAVHAGDCLHIIKTLADNSIDACVTDPPYALVSISDRFSAEDSAPCKAGKTGAYQRASAGFMGKKWDTGEVAFSVEFWREVLRVMKPGAHLAAFGGTRSYHQLACAIENAGFEIRDQVKFDHDSSSELNAFLGSLNDEQQRQFVKLSETDELGQLSWTYGVGFPKSHDVSKGIDKRRDWMALPRLQGAIASARKSIDISQSEAARRMGMIGPDDSLGGGGFMWFETGMRAPTREQWPKLKATLSIGDEFDACFEEAEREITGVAEEWMDRSNYALTSKDGFRRDKPASEDARTWGGWGTALKPAWEPICLARKPLSESTVAANVLRWRTGAINIQACKVHGMDALGGAYEVKRLKPGATLNKTGGNWRPEEGGERYHGETTPGRWPANVVTDGSDEVIAAFPDSDGAQGVVGGGEPSETGENGIYGRFARVPSAPTRGDSGSAARFFFSAKADASDRAGSKHPTVKPLALLQWLCRLICPPGGTILDPFAGTGTAGAAAWREGFNAVLIEREAEYLADIARRMKLELCGPDERARESVKARNAGKPIDLGPLFGGTEVVGGGADRSTGSSPINSDDWSDRAQVVRTFE